MDFVKKKVFFMHQIPWNLVYKSTYYPANFPKIAGIETKVPMELPKLEKKNTNNALVILFR